MTRNFWMALALCAGAGIMSATTIGLPADSGSGNCFPFGCDLGGTNTRYQQVYASSDFSGPTDIGTIDFFQTALPGGNLAMGMFTFSFSTSVNPVNGLNTTDFDANVGSDNQLFGVFNLTGSAATPELTFTGTPFHYDPVNGPLLLDIVISGFSHTGGNAYLDARLSDANGVFSRAQNFGSTSSDTGLVTEFLPASSTSDAPEPATLSLIGLGFLGIGLARRRYFREPGVTSR